MREPVMDEFQRIRRLIPERPDFHLSNWGSWRRGYAGVRGHPSRSAGLENMGGCACEEASDHVYEGELDWWAEVSDAIIQEMSIAHRIAIANLYEAAVWRFPRGNFEETVIEAARMFWVMAQKKGLL